MVHQVVDLFRAIQCLQGHDHVNWLSHKVVPLFEVRQRLICHGSILERCTFSHLHLDQACIKICQDTRSNRHRLFNKKHHLHLSIFITGNRRLHKQVLPEIIRHPHLQASIRIYKCRDSRLTGPIDQTSSPRKRKATGSQQPAPPPTSQPQYTSPPFSQGSASVSSTPQGRRRGHSRQRSDVSARGFDYGRSNRHSKAEGGFTSRNLASPMQTADAPHDAIRARRHSGVAHTVSSMLQQDDRERRTQHQEFHASPRVAPRTDTRQHDQRDQYTPERGLARHKNIIKRDSEQD